MHEDAPTPSRPKLFLVELFSGTHSVSQAIAKLGLPMEIFSVDINPKLQPTRVTDILELDYRKELNEFLKEKTKEDILLMHASPPCTQYSVAKTVGERNLQLADSLVLRALEIRDWLQPSIWTLENPRGMLRHRAFMASQAAYLNECSYCRYGMPYRKHTDIWTNVVGLQLQICCKATPCEVWRVNRAHLRSAQHGCNHAATVPGTAVLEAYRLPEALVMEIYSKGLRDLGVRL